MPPPRRPQHASPHNTHPNTSQPTLSLYLSNAPGRATRSSMVGLRWLHTTVKRPGPVAIAPSLVWFVSAGIYLLVSKCTHRSRIIIIEA